MHFKMDSLFLQALEPHHQHGDVGGVHAGNASGLAQALGTLGVQLLPRLDAQALDLADSVCPGIKKDILSGFINTTNKDVIALLKADKEDLPDMIDELRGIKKKEDLEARPPIEDSIARSMLGTVNMFITSFNDYLARFPKFRLDPTYIEKTKFLIEGLRGYLNDVEADILLASEEISKSEEEH